MDLHNFKGNSIIYSELLVRKITSKVSKETHKCQALLL